MTTILCVRRAGHVVIAGDGQVTLDKTVMKKPPFSRVGRAAILFGCESCTWQTRNVFLHYLLLGIGPDMPKLHSEDSQNH